MKTYGEVNNNMPTFQYLKIEFLPKFSLEAKLMAQPA